MLSQCLLHGKFIPPKCLAQTRATLRVLGVQGKECNTVTQLTYKIHSQCIHAQFSVLVFQSSIKLRSRLAAQELGSKGWGPTTTASDHKKKNELVTDSDLYESSLFFLHKGKERKCNHWFRKSSEESIILGLGVQTSH